MYVADICMYVADICIYVADRWIGMDMYVADVSMYVADMHVCSRVSIYVTDVFIHV